MHSQISSLVFCALILTLSSVARAQSIEQINQCIDLTKRSIELGEKEQTADIMAAYRKGVLSFQSEQVKNDMLRKFELLQNEEATSDSELLKERLLEKHLKNQRQYVAWCSDIPTNKREQASHLYEIGDVLIKLKQPDDALPVLQKCVTTDPDYAACWEKLGEASLSLGRTSEAKGFFNKAIETGGTNEMNAAAIKGAKQELFWLEHPGGDPACAPGEIGIKLHLDQCRDYFDHSPTKEGRSAIHSFGTGFFVSSQGDILTNNHVIAGCTSLTTREGKPLQVVSRKTSSDLALVRASFTPDTVAVLRSGPVPKIGDAVVAFGFPLPGILSSEGNVSAGILSATSGLQNDVRFVQISAPVQPGNSGGPLFDSSGHVIGVVVAKLDTLQVARTTGDVPQNVNFAVHWSEVRAFLDEEGIRYRREPSLHALNTRDVAAVAGRISVAIDCSH
ncbi:MAG TPA: trypsin-like peptidase domain-containing protein [Candidatus Limnocylindrales bacterium]|nr:trypsin-like peptidase domain-containing protein [Candidatus Limnocylindrales bacterium]